jgi:hypothetical protein
VLKATVNIFIDTEESLARICFVQPFRSYLVSRHTEAMAMATEAFYSPTRFSFAPQSQRIQQPQTRAEHRNSEMESCQIRGGSQVLGSNQVIGEFGQESLGINTVPCSR